MSRNDQLAAVLAELDAHGIPYEVRSGGKHVHVRWEVRAHKRTTIVSVSGSDWRAAKNARAFIRRQLRQAGIN
jgi:superfamily I DNA/RNA helicase